MRTIYLAVDPQLGASRRRHKFSFEHEHDTPSGVEADVSLNDERIGVARGIDTLTPRGREVRMWEVQLKNLYVVHGPNLKVALTEVLPHALRLIARGSAG